MTRVLTAALAALLLALPTGLVVAWSRGAAARLSETEAAASDGPRVAVAASADEGYCTPQLKQILRRVLQSCGLVGRGGERGCRPLEARNVATMSGDDFNALFLPMRERGAIVQYDLSSSDLDAADAEVIDGVFADRRGASYFLVVARASPEGSVQLNRELSRTRAEAVLAHLAETFRDPDIESRVGLLWLGEEYAQLGESFCDWRRSGPAEACRPEDINRSAFIAWIDCRL